MLIPLIGRDIAYLVNVALAFIICYSPFGIFQHCSPLLIDDGGGNEYLLDVYMYYAEVARAKVSGKVPISNNMPTNQKNSCRNCQEFNFL